MTRHLIASALIAASSAFAADYLAFAGTYTRGDSQGIYSFRFDTATGKLTPIGLAAETTNPSFLTIHQNGRYLYAVNEVAVGTVTAFSIDKTSGKLTELNQVSAKGSIPCHLQVDKTGRFLVVVNYGSGSTVSLPILPDGRLGQSVSFHQHTGSSASPRQKGPHAHSINFSPDYRYAVVADLGIDKVLTYKFNAKDGALAPASSIDMKPGAGPRHFTFSPNGKFGYAINELDSTVTAMRYQKGAGAFTALQTVSTLPEGWKGSNTTAETRIHPSGRFLYGSNRGHDSLAVFSVDRNSGKLTYVENVPTQGRTPRNFVIDPSGQFLIAENMDTHTIVIFRIDQATGKLTPTGDKLNSPSPVCLRFLKL
ncbi:MAG: lactonase family protein [Bryobacterales bacterium]|nr:lactonase family protein [Bryobacterales bacterium]